MPQAIEAMKHAYAALSAGTVQAPPRARLSIAPHDALSLIMPAYVQSDGSEVLAVKIVSLFPGNPALGLALVQAAVLVFDAETGRVVALLEGSSLTAIRTGAGSGAAIDLLARPDSQTVAIFGAGTQGRTHLEAACTVRKIRAAWVFDTNPEKAAAFAHELAGRGPIPSDLTAASTSKEALAEADIVCTATTSSSPVFSDDELKPGVHISAVGSYTPEMQELPSATIQRARIVVDSRSAALAEAGDLVQPLRLGLISESNIHGELGEIVLGRKSGRQSPAEITVFKSVGVAVQDALAGQLALKNAANLGLGIEIPF
jgi:ornithine cyclodeaminase